MSSKEPPRRVNNSSELWLEDYERLVNAADQFWDNGDLEEAMLFLQQASALASEQGALLEQGTCLNSLGLVQEQAGQIFIACETLTQAVEVLQQTKATEYLATVLNNLGFFERNLGNLEMARQHHEMALELLKSVPESEEVVRSLSNLGLIYKDKGLLTEAMAYFERSLKYFGTDEVALREKAHILLGMGLTLELLNNVEGTREYYQQALETYRQVGDQENEALTLHNLGQLEDNEGHFLEALDYYFQSLSINLTASRTNCALGVAEDLSSLAALIEIAQEAQDEKLDVDSSIRLEHLLTVYMHSLRQELVNSGKRRALDLSWMDELSETDGHRLSRQLREQALKLHESIGNRRGQIWLLTDMAIVARNQQAYGEAEEFLERVLKLAQDLASPRELYETYLILGDVRMIAGEIQQAIITFEKAAEIAESLRLGLLREAEALSYFNESNLMVYERLVRLSARDQPKRALEYLEQMKGREFLRRLRWGEVVRSRHVPKDLLVRESKVFNQLQRALEELEQLSERDAVDAINTYRIAEQQLLMLWIEIAAIDPEYVALRQGQPLTWKSIKKFLQV